jgi:alpha-galactosidase/6-phospho-beta-glucosidase family protein
MTLEGIARKNRLWEDLRAQASGAQSGHVSGDQEAERLVAIAEAPLSERDHLELAVGLANNGKIPNLPSTAVVEVPLVVEAAGITGFAVGPLPEAIAAVLTARAAQQEVTVRAALSGDRQLALRVLVIDPLVPDSATARAILDDAIAADPTTPRRFSS